MKQEINIIEIDSRDARYQSGIARYLDVLSANMPKNIKTYRIIFYHSPKFTDVRITETENELQVYHPAGYPSSVLFDAAIHMIGNKLNNMPNLIVKSNCLGYDQFLYMLRTRFYCKTMGVLHCLPHRGGKTPSFPSSNPFFNMDHVVLVCDLGREFLDGVKNKRPFSVIYNGIAKPKIKNKHPNDGVFRFIFANGWAPLKGFKKIIPAIRSVAKTHKIEVIVLGGSWNDEKDNDEIAGLPIVKTGLINDPAEIERYYEMADCALFASETEACSFAGIEAMAYDLPIVSTDAAGLVEMFGNAALFVPMNQDKEFSTSDYADKMIQIIENRRLRVRLGVLGYARYIEKYTAKKMASDTIKLYQKLLK